MRNRGKCVVGAGRLHFLLADGVEGEFGVVGSVRVCVRYYFNGGFRGDLRVVGAVVDDGVFERVGDGAAGVAVLDDSGSGDVCVDVFCGYDDGEPVRIEWSFVLIVFSECLLHTSLVWGRGRRDSVCLHTFPGNDRLFRFNAEEALDVHQGTTECVLIAQRSSIDEIRQKAHDQIVKSIIFKRKVFSHELQ